ncbi:hypothetical protein D3C78_669320 [compost metagenome]
MAVEYTAQPAGREDVARCAEQGVVGNRMGAELLHGQLHLAVIDVTDQQFGTGGVQLFGQCVPDIAQALDGHAQAFEVVAAEPGHGGAADAGEHSHRRVWRGVARRGGAGDVLGLLGDAIHVRH